MKKHAERCADMIRRTSEALVVSHIDADGLTSAAIIATALEDAGIEYSTIFEKQLGKDELSEIADTNPPLVIFTDLGSGVLGNIKELGITAVVSDHHQPSTTDTPPPRDEHLCHLNPHLFGISGSRELSGSGTTFLLARSLIQAQGHDNRRGLPCLAVVGAVGDLQHVKEGRLTGANRTILKIGAQNKELSYTPDLAFFGKQTRPIFKLLEYATDPYLTGLTGNEDACITFLKGIGIRLQGERWRRWIDLEENEKQKIVSSLIQHQITRGIPAHRLQRMVQEVYTLKNENEGTELRDAQEYSTLLNATARYDRAEIGLNVCMGDREDALEDVAGMSHSTIGNRNLPIIAFARASTPHEKEGLKVSARANTNLLQRGLNLGRAIHTAAEKVNGTGGGHDIAAGATISLQTKNEFIKHLNEEIKKQTTK
ncbi:recombinase RecJ [Methanosarcinales archaeon ex4484_138]|nr:MAG: recombinase RecJ [Methanosarcinales archaeon ex4484_138]